MWRRVVSSSSAPYRSNRRFLVCSSSSLATAPFKGSSFHTSFASSSSSAFATNHEHEEIVSEFEGRNNTSRQNDTYNEHYSQNNRQWQQEVSQIPDGFNSQSSSVSHWSINHISMHNSAKYQQTTIDYNRSNSSAQHQQNTDNYYKNNTTRYQQSISYGQYQSSPHVGEYQQNPQVGQYQQLPQVGQYQQNPQVGQYQQLPQVGQYQQRPQVGQYQQIPHVGQYQQPPQVGQYQQRPQVGQYQQRPQVGQYQQSPQVEQYQQSPQVGQYQQRPRVGEYQQTPQVEQPTEAYESNPNKMSPLEEMDSFCKEGKAKEAVEVLGLLEKQQVHVSLDQYLQLIQVCGEDEALEEARVVHEKMSLLSPLEVTTYNRILEMYWKCGSIEDASMVFNNMPKRNLTSWDIMITWLAKNGLGEDAIDLFTQFKKAGLKPDGQMFIGVFYACAVVGDAEEGLLHFESMSKDYGIVPTMDHYVSVVDMLGTIGLLDEALEFVGNMPMEPSVDVWTTLMNLCRVHGYLELGDRCAELVDKMDPSCLNEQSKAGLLPAKESDLKKEKEKKQQAAKNLLEVRSRVHEYRAGDRSHPDNEKFYSLLRGLREQMKEAGYIPETRFVLHDIDQEGKEDALLSHSERLAVADGFLNSSARSPIRVIKNLRVCGDCHSALKIISKIVGRELIMRDAKRFHHLKDGKCSCNDYW